MAGIVLKLSSNLLISEACKDIRPLADNPGDETLTHDVVDIHKFKMSSQIGPHERGVEMYSQDQPSYNSTQEQIYKRHCKKNPW